VVSHGDMSTISKAVTLYEYDLIVLTQSCDLENKKARLVALCPVFLIQEFEAVNPNFKQKGAWENVRRGRVEGLHLLASPTAPEDIGASPEFLHSRLCTFSII
jgi:hypothetical protein